MAVTFADFKKRRDIVIVNAWSRSHMLGFYSKRRSLMRNPRSEQASPQDFIQGLAKGDASRTGFVFETLNHVLVQRNRRSDAHDARILASFASDRKLTSTASAPTAPFVHSSNR